MRRLPSLWIDLLGYDSQAAHRAAGALARFGQEQRFDPGEVPEGVQSQTVRLHVVVEGWLADQHVLQKGERHLSDLVLPGEAAGLTSFILGRGPYEIEAVTPSRIVSLSRTDMNRMRRADPDGAAALREITFLLRERQRLRLARRAVTLARLSGAEKLCHIVCELVARIALMGGAGFTDQGEWDEAGLAPRPPQRVTGPLADAGTRLWAEHTWPERVVLPVPQRRLAEMTGMTHIHLNRVLKELKAQGLVEAGRGALHVLEPGLAMRISDFEGDYLDPRVFWPGEGSSEGSSESANEGMAEAPAQNASVRSIFERAGKPAS